VLWGFTRKAVGGGIEGVVLQILKQRAMKFAGATLGRKGDVANLREFGIVIERSYFDFGDALL